MSVPGESCLDRKPSFKYILSAKTIKNAQQPTWYNVFIITTKAIGQFYKSLNLYILSAKTIKKHYNRRGTMLFITQIGKTPDL